MNYIKRSKSIAVLGFVVTLLSGCSETYEVWLFNHSGLTDTVILSDHSEIRLENEATRLFDPAKGENVLLPTLLKIKNADRTICYKLQRIKVGGYGDFDETGTLQVRLKLGDDLKIFVYSIAAGKFDPAQPVGPQPEGYPASPTACEPGVSPRSPA